MQTTDDRALLRQYVETGSEDAFSELLGKHVNLVYSAALRRVGNHVQAEEITQAVFVVLARKAAGLSPKVVLSGWLYRATGLAAANLIRSEARRVRREKESFMQSPANEIENDAWAQIAPMLDDAMDGLNGGDREAIVMRFFEGKSMQEVGSVCGISENAAKKRVYHGLERLRKFFSKRGVVLTGAMIAGMMTSKSVQAAPVGLVGRIAVVAKGGVVSELVAGTLKLMLWEKLKLALVYGAAGLVVVGAAVPIASRVLASDAKMPGMHLEGTVTEYQFDQNGNITRTNFGEFLNGERFELWRKGAQWAVRLSSAETNLPGSVSIVTSDGTDIYVYVPDVAGGSGLPNNLVKSHGAASIYPGTMKAFNMFMAPLWWGFCSSLAEAGDGPMPDFVNPRVNPVHPAMPAETALLHVFGNNTDVRLGPIEMALSQKDGRTGKFSTDPYCDILPMEVTNIDGVTVVTKYQMRRYYWSMEYTGGKPAVLERYDIAVDKAERDDSFTAFVPELEGMTQMQDYRAARFVDIYLSDHWVDPGETVRHSAIPVVLGPLGKDVNAKTLEKK